MGLSVYMWNFLRHEKTSVTDNARVALIGNEPS